MLAINRTPINQSANYAFIDNACALSFSFPSFFSKFGSRLKLISILDRIQT